MNRTIVFTALAMAGVACNSAFEPGGDLPVRISLQTTIVSPGPVVKVRAEVRNESGGVLTIRVQCSAILLDRDESGSWRRVEDLRLCGPPDRMTFPAGATFTLEEERLLAAGRYRAVIESIDGRSARSEPFSVAASP